uniref:Uncharacterized protein n=1 Tax=Strigamia maritima TaxID=126957 RepID=T1IMM3_STRMM
MQDLRIAPFFPKEAPSFIPYPKMEESTGDALNSARGSETFHSLLYQQVEMKDRVISDMTQHLQDISRKLEMSEEQRCQLLLKLEDKLKTSLDIGSEAEKFAAEMKRVEEMAAEVQAENVKNHYKTVLECEKSL